MRHPIPLPPSTGPHGQEQVLPGRLQGPDSLCRAHLFSLSFRSPCNTVRSIWKLLMCKARMIAYAVILAFIEFEIKFRKLQSVAMEEKRS